MTPPINPLPAAGHYQAAETHLLMAKNSLPAVPTDADFDPAGDRWWATTAGRHLKFAELHAQLAQIRTAGAQLVLAQTADPQALPGSDRLGAQAEVEMWANVLKRPAMTDHSGAGTGS